VVITDKTTPPPGRERISHTRSSCAGNDRENDAKSNSKLNSFRFYKLAVFSLTSGGIEPLGPQHHHVKLRVTRAQKSPAHR